MLAFPKYKIYPKSRPGWEFLGEMYGELYWKHLKCGILVPESRICAFGFGCSCELEDKKS